METLGGVAPLGITGSGLIALVAAFLALGLLTPEGRLKSPGEMADLPEVLRERLQAGANGQEVLIDKESGVTITQKDIRLLQLAKGAVRAAVDSLLDEAEVVPEELDTIMLQVLSAGRLFRSLRGSFRYRGRIKFLGNAAGRAVQALF